MVDGSATRRIGRAVVALGMLAASLTALSCHDMFSPDALSGSYMLRSIGGVPLDSTENVYLRCQADYAVRGGELYWKSVSVRIYDIGVYESRMRFRWRAEVVSRPSPEFPATDAEQNSTFLYARRDRELVLSGRDGSSVVRLTPDGALEQDGICGVWRFERGAP